MSLTEHTTPDRQNVQPTTYLGDATALPDQFKAAMRRLTASVAIIATRDGEAPVGMVATAVISVSAEPPSLLICLNRTASVHAPLLEQRRFIVNMLSAEQSDLVPIFAGRDIKGSARFAHGQWLDLDGLPRLVGAQSSIVCTLDKLMSHATHDVIIGRVDAVHFAEACTPLLWENGQPAVSARLA